MFPLEKILDPVLHSLLVKIESWTIAKGPNGLVLHLRGGGGALARFTADDGVVERIILEREDPLAVLVHPDYAALFRELAKYSIFENALVYIRNPVFEWNQPHYIPILYDEDEDDFGIENMPNGKPLTIKQFSKHVKDISVIAPDCESFEGDELVLESFTFPTILDIAELTFYHATRASHIPLIRQYGLLPALDARHLVTDPDAYLAGREPEYSPAMIGWTEINLHLQNAVYLTADQYYAEDIARTLALRWEEDAHIIEVPGVLLDHKKTSVDEDAFYDNYGYSPGYCWSEYPRYISSLANPRLYGIAYLDKLPGDLEIVRTISYKDLEDDQDYN